MHSRVIGILALATMLGVLCASASDARYGMTAPTADADWLAKQSVSHAAKFGEGCLVRALECRSRTYMS